MKYKILELLKNKADYVSGQEIADSFGISRTAVWKYISKLKAEGYTISSVSSKGYLLENMSDILNEGEIKYRPLKFVSETESTNNLAKSMANDGCSDGMLVLCDNQTKGKGRLGRTWISQKSVNLSMSIVLRPDIMPFETPKLTLVAGIACARAINSITGVDCGIKWPNDIIINGKKIVGILTEMSAEMEYVRYVVIGIGVNVNNDEFDDEIKDKASSLYMITGKKFRRSDIADKIISELVKLYDVFCKEGFTSLCDEYNSLCINIGKQVKTLGRQEITGTALGVNENGELVIESKEGKKNILSGEVSVRLANDEYI